MNNYGFTWTTSGELAPAKTLRDEFAMAALKDTAGALKDTHPPVEIAEWCYIMADAMMEAREK